MSIQQFHFTNSKADIATARQTCPLMPVTFVGLFVVYFTAKHAG